MKRVTVKNYIYFCEDITILVVTRYQDYRDSWHTIWVPTAHGVNILVFLIRAVCESYYNENLTVHISWSIKFKSQHNYVINND